MSNKERFIWKEGDIEIIKSPGNKKEAGKEDVGDRVCWNCKYLISPVWSLPPVFRKAYPDGNGISIDILSG